MRQVEGRPTYLNFEARFPDQPFTAVIWARDLAEFPEEIAEYFEGRRFCVTGPVTEYRGVPQMELRSRAAVHLRESGSQDASYSLHLAEADTANKAGRFAVAAAAFRSALGVKPDSAQARVGLGIALVNSDPGAAGYREAAALLEQAVKVDDANARAWLALGMAHQFVGRKGPAAEAYRRYLALEPRGESAEDVRAMLRELGP